jgi:hypothetical protein
VSFGVKSARVPISNGESSYLAANEVVILLFMSLIALTVYITG